jgi:ABC-2 type transport system permease protein
MTDHTAASTRQPARRLPFAGTLLAEQVRYQLSLLLATPNALVIGVGLPVILLVAANVRHSGSAVSGLAGFAAFGMTLTAWNTHGIRLVAARETGVLKRWRASPLPRWCYLAGRIVTTALFATAAGAVTVAAGVLFYHQHITATGWLGVLIALILGALAWATAATATTGIIPSVETANPVFVLVYFPVIIISGVLGTISAEPAWLSRLASYLPAQPVIDAMNRAVRHAPGASFVSGRDVLVLVAWIAGTLMAALIVFRWEPSRPARRRPARADGRPARPKVSDSG